MGALCRKLLILVLMFAGEAGPVRALASGNEAQYLDSSVQPVLGAGLSTVGGSGSIPKARPQEHSSVEIISGENMDRSDGHIITRRAFEYPLDCYEGDGVSLKPEYRYLAAVAASEITYWSDGLRISGFLVKPSDGGKHPCIIFNRGGNRDFSSITPQVVVNLLCKMASWGYVVAASQYRGHGVNEGKDEFGGKDVDDVMNLFPLLDAEPGVDPGRIGMYGGSRGGMMTYLALARTERIRAAVVRCGVSDLTDWRHDRDDMVPIFQELIPGFGTNPDTALVTRSAVKWTDKLCKRTPILLLQGAADWRVNPASALHMAEALLANRHPFRLVVLEGGDHALTEHLAERDRQMREWFDRFVRDDAPLPDTRPHGD